MMYEPVDSIQASSQRTTTTTTPPPPSDEIYSNYLTAFSDLSNYRSTTMEQVHSTLSYVNENRLSTNCSLFNDLIEMLRDVRKTLFEYRKFTKQFKNVYENACLNFEKKATIPLMNRYNYIKISGFVNYTEFICKDIIESGQLIDYAKIREIYFMTRFCIDCRRTRYFDPSLCIHDTGLLDDVELSDEYVAYIDAFIPYMALVSNDLPTIFRNFSKCPSRRAPFPCTTILTTTLDNLEVYITFVRSYKNSFDLIIDFFSSLSLNTPMDNFIEIQIEGEGGRSSYLNIEANYLQSLYDDYTEILFRML